MREEVAENPELAEMMGEFFDSYIGELFYFCW